MPEWPGSGMWEKGRGVPIERETFSINDFVAGEGV